MMVTQAKCKISYQDDKVTYHPPDMDPLPKDDKQDSEDGFGSWMIVQEDELRSGRGNSLIVTT